MAMTITANDASPQQSEPRDAHRLADSVCAYLRTHRNAALSFWTRANAPPACDLIDLCDIAYTLILIGRIDDLAHDAPARFAAHLRTLPLAGGLAGAAGTQHLTPHLTAYALGTLNIQQAPPSELFETALGAADWRLGDLIDLNTLRPRFPKLWAHHSWRSSHWIGGAPSILLSLSRALPKKYAEHGGPPLSDVLAASDDLLDPATGFLRLYQSDMLHAAFNAAYKLRHDPVAAELGGVVHLHWVNYAAGRLPFVANAALRASTIGALPTTPFMETTPYCLDFDILHLLRTTSDDCVDANLAPRIQRYASDLHAFLGASLKADYKLHRLPGALAALHECALMLQTAQTQGLEAEPIDIIAKAYWL